MPLIAKTKDFATKDHTNPNNVREIENRQLIYYVAYAVWKQPPEMVQGISACFVALMGSNCVLHSSLPGFLRRTPHYT
jgi:hypothetical protein